MIRVLDLFSCIGAHATGLQNAGGFKTTRFVEINPYRRQRLAELFPGVEIHDDANSYAGHRGEADAVIGGPPCQRTSAAAAIHGYRSGDTLWPAMFRIAYNVDPEWIVVEQPCGSSEWETDVSRNLASIGRHVARAEFAVSDLGGPHPRRRVFILANRSLPRLALAWESIPREIAAFAGAGPDRNPWATPFAGELGVDAGDGVGRVRQERIEAIGDSNPPAMMEIIGRAILAAETMP